VKPQTARQTLLPHLSTPHPLCYPGPSTTIALFRSIVRCREHTCEGTFHWECLRSSKPFDTCPSRSSIRRRWSTSRAYLKSIGLCQTDQFGRNHRIRLLRYHPRLFEISFCFWVSKTQFFRCGVVNHSNRLLLTSNRLGLQSCQHLSL